MTLPHLIFINIYLTLQFSAPTYSINEDGDILEPLVTVTRTGSSVGAVSATVNFTGGTATGSTTLLADYFNQPITVNFADGETTAKKIIVPIWDDSVVEGNETINLSLSNPTGGAAIGTQEIATVTIVDNDTASTSGILQFSSPTYSINENGTPVAAITVTRTGGSTGAVSARINFTGGTATGGTPTLVSPEDYDNTPLAVNFADGETTKMVVIPIIDDTLIEDNETINLTLSNPTGGATIGAQNTASLIVVDNDAPSDDLTLIGSDEDDTLVGGNGNDTLYGGSGSDSLRGQAGDDKLYGQAGNDSIVGGDGNDILVGGFNGDILTGGAGADRFVRVYSTTGIDTITDFQVGEDWLCFSAKGFGGDLVRQALLDESQFTLGTAASDTSDRFIYDATTGALFFDIDGTDDIEQVQIATLSPGLALTSTDIYIMA